MKAGKQNPEDLLTSDALAELPDELRDTLREATVALNLEIALSIIEQIQEYNQPLAGALRELIHDYRFDVVQDFLDSV